MATRFVSPFISDETEGEGDLTIPDAVLFNDSLDEGVDPTALLDDADLPIECAAAEPKPGSLSQIELNDSLNAEDLDETQLPASDDDLARATVETEATTCVEPKAITPPQADGNKEQSKFSPKASSPLVEKKAKAASLEGKVIASSVESQPSKGAAKVKPSFGKKKKGFTPPKVTKAATTTNQSENKKLPEKSSDQSSSNANDKTPPQSSSPETGADAPKQQPQSSDVKTTSEKVPSSEAKTVKVADKKMIVEEKKREKEKKEQERSLKKQALEQKKLDREKKKAELERQRNEKRLELERKKAEREQKKMEKELKKMEREQKKAEKQAKASQKQQTKDKKPEDTINSEASDKNDEVEPSSELVVEDRNRDTEQESKVDEGANKTDIAMKSGEQAPESNVKEKENIPPIEKQSSEMSTKDAAAALSPIANCGDESKTQKTKFSSLKKGDNQQKTDEADTKEKELNEAPSDDAGEREELAKDTTAAASPVSKSNGKEKAGKTFSTPKKGGDQQKISDSGVKKKEKIPLKEAGRSEASEHHEELNKNTTTAASPVANKSTTEVSRDGTTKQKEKKVKKFSPPKAKKDANKAGKEVKKQRKAVIKMSRVGNFSGAGDDMSKKTQAGAQAGGKEKKRKPSVYSDSEDEFEPKRAKSANNFGSVWVQCENANCKKWRLLRDCDDPAKVPGKWMCSMNTDPDHNSCSAEEEQWSDLGDSQEFVESPFIPGSLVWSKMDGYPWWPAMIEEDPNKETYYEMGYRDSPIPVRYHVVFFDIPVSRGWVSSLHTLPYTGHNDPNKDGSVNVPQRLKRTLTEGKKQANKALGLSVKERLETLGFAKRFRGSRRKRQAEDSPEALPSQSKYRKTTSSGERKSARLRVSVEEEEGAMPVVSLKPLQSLQPDNCNEEVVNTNTKGSCDDGLVQQHEE